MALRVLLADESATIKKVMQISLQDFAVEVRAVQMGLDVLQVAQQFKPDIIFVDILLQKKNGYDVSQELKRDPQTRAIPVVLMWSGFMEVDNAKIKASMADDQLEKPFDADALRALITKLVPKTKAQNLAAHLDFPETTRLENTQTQTQTKTTVLTKTSAIGIERIQAPRPAKVPEPPPPPPPIVSPEPEAGESTWSMDSFEDLSDFSAGKPADDSEEFKRVPLNALESENDSTKSGFGEAGEGELELGDYSSAEEDNWIQKDLSSFKVDIPEGDEEPIALDFDVNDDELENIINTQTKPMSRIDASRAAAAKAAKAAPVAREGARSASPAQSAAAQIQPLSKEEIEKIVREQSAEIIRQQSAEIIEKVVRKLVPDIASQLIKEEIRRLLDETP
ncbi:MAG TPA: response regulator [Bdellovibrionales bacterium]|nr:response regulator [Bdellovibrionales bacterium]